MSSPLHSQGGDDEDLDPRPNVRSFVLVDVGTEQVKATSSSSVQNVVDPLADRASDLADEVRPTCESGEDALELWIRNTLIRHTASVNRNGLNGLS